MQESQARRGSTNPRWRGGTKTNEYGYIRVSAGRYRDKLLHLLIYEWFYGPVPDGHTVHHKDGDRLNFHPENLVALPAEDHGRISSNKRWREIRKRAEQTNSEEVPF